MAKWFVDNAPLDIPEVGQSRGCFRVHPEGEPQRWVVRTNPALPPEAQEEFAELIAELLSSLL